MANQIIPEENAKGGNGPAPKEETVTISKDVLDNILNKLTDLEAGQKEFEQTASKDQMQKIEKLRASGKLVKKVKIAKYQGRQVKSWKTTIDEVHIDPSTGKEISKQEMKLTFFEGKEVTLKQLDFARLKTLESFEVIKQAKTADGEVELTVLGDTGEEIVINKKYVNY